MDIIAIPSMGNGGLKEIINPRFGRCQQFTIVSIENGEIVEVRSVLKKGGQIQMLLSSAAPMREILQLIQRTKYHRQILARGRLLRFLEHLFLFQFW